MPFSGYLRWGETLYLHHQLRFTRWNDSRHATGSYFFLAFCSQQPFRVYWGGAGGRGKSFTYIISFVSHVGMFLATLQALTSFCPYAHGSHLGLIGVEGMGGRGETLHLHHQLCFTRCSDSCHPTGSYFFLPLCSQQPFRVYWGGGEGVSGALFYTLERFLPLCRLLLLSGHMLTAAI